ncbi:ABC transporter ATP-binding protein [Weissella paramesenteroides]|uniref:ABC transporter ATP-binding protein n=1 Tax=Weissella paramesenteroides TaxID=1249 RepID=UPI00223BD569|nr:ABC transporter ATP-binding protein [Weissella paramesenteroides]MCS9983630.1 ABC transporter ATP-binding protein [Weissella paramesenteroides]MCS9997454.1 ABC transporter ATP-binding protein [Weissella paramesenteroides]MCT0259392.1 ABC transporter ATP-binding protein [Weissella paramesenteroides]
MKAITVRGVRKDFGKLAVLKGIDLDVEQGEVFTLLGANGAGKSTLINILTTLSRPNHGTVSIMGLDPIQDGNRVRKLISLNAQTATLDDEFSGMENLRLVAQLRGVKDRKTAITTLAERLDLTSFLNRQVKTYSGGMRRRLDIAMSLIGNPQIVFLDEPTTGVDPQNRLALWQMIREIRDAGKTVFLTTQYLDEADALSDHIGFIHDGVIVKYGTPNEIKQRVITTYTVQVKSGEQKVAENALAMAGIDYTIVEHNISLSAVNAKKALAVLLATSITIERFDRDESDLESIFLNVINQGGSYANN